MKHLIILVCKYWKKLISPLLGNNCRYVPSCSDYMIESVEEYGSLEGLKKGTLRILKCNSLFKGGFDPVGTDAKIKHKDLSLIHISEPTRPY